MIVSGISLLWRTEPNVSVFGNWSKRSDIVVTFCYKYHALYLIVLIVPRFIKLDVLARQSRITPGSDIATRLQYIKYMYKKRTLFYWQLVPFYP